jgi:hypothetical protein
MAEHVRMWPGNTHTSSFGQPPQAASSGVSVHPGAAGVDQDRPASTDVDRPVDGPPDGRRQRDQDDLGAFAAHTQHTVAVLFADISDVGAAGFEDP